MGWLVKKNGPNFEIVVMYIYLHLRDMYMYMYLPFDWCDAI